MRSGEVRKFGTRIKLGEQPLRILVQLIERPGELVTRAELRERLWSQDTFVDFDHGLNSAIQRLRDGLSDTADKAQWIETVPRRGYRFVGQVEWNRSNGSGAAPPETAAIATTAVEAPVSTQQVPQSANVPSARRIGRWRFVTVGLAVLLAAVVIGRIARERLVLHRASGIRSLAVLPLENLSGDASQEYFVDGITNEITTALAKNRSLQIVSHTSAMQYKGVHRPLRDIARELGVDGILEGSMMVSGDRVHLTVQLIHAASDTHIWAESYDRELKEAFSLPTELSQTIAKEVKLAVSAAGPERYVNPEAHDAYLRGRYYWFSDNDTRSLQYFQKAIQLQPDYAAAWSGLAYYYGGRAAGGEPSQKFEGVWETAARKAVELDDSLPEAHNSLAAFYLFGKWDPVHADSESQRAIALDPNYAEGHHVRCYVLSTMNHLEEALQEQKRATEIDPLQRPWALGVAYMRLHQFDAAINELRLRVDANPRDSDTRMVLAEAYWLKGLDKEFAQELERAYRIVGDNTSAGGVQKAFEQGGGLAVAAWQLKRDKASARKETISPFWLAHDSAHLRRKEETLRFLEDAYREHCARLVYLQVEPIFDFLHTDPRYRALVKKIGLTPAF